jgi:hypothetical protein
MGGGGCQIKLLFASISFWMWDGGEYHNGLFINLLAQLYIFGVATRIGKEL